MRKENCSPVQNLEAKNVCLRRNNQASVTFDSDEKQIKKALK